MCGERKQRTIVPVQTPFSTSHVRTVESNPQLYAYAPPSRPNPKTTRETRAVWLLSTAAGALRFGRAASSLSSATLRRFFLSAPPVVSSAGTSSVSGIEVSQKPIRPSHDEVRMCDPDAFAATEERGAVWRCRDARVCAFEGPAEGERSMRVRRAVRSCDALAMRCASGELEGTMAIEDTGAVCAETV